MQRTKGLYQLSLLVFSIASFSTVTAQEQFSKSDCIINGVKGATAPNAVNAVTQACEAKERAFKAGKLRRLTEDFGQSLDVKTIALATGYDHADGGYLSIAVTNVSAAPQRTVKYIRLGIWTSLSQDLPCDGSSGVTYAYQTTLKPGRSVRLLYPPNGARYFCHEVSIVRGTDPSWSDVSLSDNIKPLDHDPFEEFDR